MLEFSSAEIGSGAIKTARSTGMVSSATASLFSTLVLDVRVLGLSLLPSSVLANAVRTAIAPLAPLIDVTIDAVLDVLGISLGEADVQVL